MFAIILLHVVVIMSSGVRISCVLCSKRLGSKY